MAKETFMHIPILYHFALRPDKSSHRIRTVIDKAYRYRCTDDAGGG